MAEIMLLYTQDKKSIISIQADQGMTTIYKYKA